MTASPQRLLSICLAAAVTLGTAAGCTKKGATALAVTSSDDTCSLERSSVADGSLTLRIENTGSETTEVYVLSGSKVLAEREDIAQGQTRDLSVDLKPGAYTVRCKPGMKGDGIDAELTVGDGGGSSSGTEEAGEDDGIDVQMCADPEATRVEGLAKTAFVDAQLSDFAFSLSTESVTGPTIALTARNVGKYPHEMVFARVPRDDLAVGRDGTVDEDSLPEGSIVAELESFRPGTACANVFELPPGDYTVFCNIGPGEGHDTQGHAGLGMIAELTVTK